MEAIELRPAQIRKIWKNDVPSKMKEAVRYQASQGLQPTKIKLRVTRNGIVMLLGPRITVFANWNEQTGYYVGQTAFRRDSSPRMATRMNNAMLVLCSALNRAPRPESDRRQHVRTDLLLQLADLLDTVPRERFNYRFWFVGEGSHQGVGDCGTVACALGWATKIPECRLEVRDPGLVFHKDSDAEGGLAAMRAFGIDWQTAHRLFYPNCEASPSADASPKEVAAWIRKVVAEYEAEHEERPPMPMWIGPPATTNRRKIK